MAVSNEFRDYVMERLGPIGDVRGRVTTAPDETAGPGGTSARQ
jgi:hypothetical protein